MVEREHWRKARTDFERLVDQLGISRIHLHSDDEPAGIVHLIDSKAELIPGDPDLIASWVSAVLADERYPDTTRKLAPIGADEHQVFLRSGSLTGIAIDENLKRVRPDWLPLAAPSVPDHVWHVWAVSTWRTAYASLWTRGMGWSAVPVPAPSDEPG